MLTEKKTIGGHFYKRKENSCCQTFCRLCLNFTSLPLSSIHHIFCFRFFLIIEKNKVCEKGSVLTSVPGKLSVNYYFFLTERTARVMKMVITSQLFSELP